MSARRLLLALSLAAVLLGSAPAALVGASPVETAAASTTAYSPPTGAGVMGYMESYVMTHPYRLHNLPTHAKARDSLVSELQSFGFYVERHAYSGGVLSGGGGVNIVAYQNGTTKPNEWIVLSAHYDTTETTVYGAWDDGAGVAQLLELARSGSTRTYNRTIVYAFFDDEEQGLYGSKAFAAKYRSKVVGNLNFDPPGLNWPCADPDGTPLAVKASFNEVKTSQNKPGYVRIKNAVISGLDAAGVPADARDLRPAIPIASVFGAGLSGTSDHASFDAWDIPNAFVGSLPTTEIGMVALLNYPLHTPSDDLLTMIARCGGSRATLEAAFGVQLVIVTTALGILDGP